MACLRCVSSSDCEQCKRFVDFVPQRTHFFPFEFIDRRLGASVAGGQRTALAGECDVQAKVMPAELNHPRIGRGGLSQKRNVVVVASEVGAAATTASGTSRSAAAARSTWAAASATRSTATAAVAAFQHFVGLNDLLYLFVPFWAERRFQHRHRCIALRLGQVAHAQAYALNSTGG